MDPEPTKNYVNLGFSFHRSFASPTHPPPHASTFSAYPQAPLLFPIPQVDDTSSSPSLSLPAGVQIHRALAVPNLLYDMRYQPSRSNPTLSSAILSAPASNPPLPFLELRIGDLPWKLTVRPDAGLSLRSGYVTVQDVLLAIYFHLRRAVKAEEYSVVNKSKKMEIFRAFERRVASDSIQRSKGLWRIDFLGGRFHAQGLSRAPSDDQVLDVVVY